VTGLRGLLSAFKSDSILHHQNITNASEKGFVDRMLVNDKK